MTPEERKKYVTTWVNARRKEGGLRGTRLTKGYRARFMLDFDNGKYPELVIAPTPIKIGKTVVG